MPTVSSIERQIGCPDEFVQRKEEALRAQLRNDTKRRFSGKDYAAGQTRVEDVAARAASEATLPLPAGDMRRAIGATIIALDPIQEEVERLYADYDKVDLTVPDALEEAAVEYKKGPDQQAAREAMVTPGYTSANDFIGML